MSVDVASTSGEYSWGTLACRPAGYGCQSATCQELATGGRVSYYTFSPAVVSFAPTVVCGTTKSAVDAPTRPASPATVLRHMPSFSSLPSESDFDVASSGDENEVSTRLAAALQQLRRSRSRSGSASPKGSLGAGGDAAACAACKRGGILKSAMVGSGASSGAASPVHCMEA